MISSDRRILEAARTAQRAAYAPYSRFAVGAAVRAGAGRIVAAANVENASYGLTICAERAAVCAAVAAGWRRLDAVAIVTGGPAPVLPCGACLQVLAEFAGPDLLILSATARDMAHPLRTRLGELLPRAFRLDPGP